ncbi:MAG: restriction endonuclease subunit S [Mycobacterium sp.]
MSWPVVALDEVAEIQGGIQKQPKRAPKENFYPFLRVANVTAAGLNLREIHSIELFGDEIKRYRLEAGDLLVVEGNGSASQIGRAAVWDGSIADAVHQNHLIRVRPKPLLDARFLGHVWNSPLVRDELSRVASSTSGLHTLSVAKLKRIVLPLPPSDEQRHIVCVLDDCLSRLEAAKAAVARSVKRLSAMREAFLAVSVRDAQDVVGSRVVPLGELGQVLTGATPLKANKAFYENGTIPWVTSGDLHRGIVAKASQFVTEFALRETNLKLLPPGSLLVAMYGEGRTRGTVAELGISATTNQACAAVVIHDPGLQPWIRLVLDANYNAMRRMAAGGVQPNLNLSLVRSIEVPIPPEPYRDDWLSRLAEIDTTRRRLAQGLQQAQARGEQLRRTILAAAFSGRLTSARADYPMTACLHDQQADQADIGRRHAWPSDHGRDRQLCRPLAVGDAVIG